MTNLNAAEVAYLNQLAADIAENGGPTGDMMADMRAGHARRQAFMQEMANGNTARAQHARRALTVSIHEAARA